MTMSRRMTSYTYGCTGAGSGWVEVKALLRTDGRMREDERILVDGDFVETALPALAKGELAARS